MIDLTSALVHPGAPAFTLISYLDIFFLRGLLFLPPVFYLLGEIHLHRKILLDAGRSAHEIAAERLAITLLRSATACLVLAFGCFLFAHTTL